MNARRILLIPVILLGFSGCWLDEARAPKQQSLNIVADRLTAEDSTLIRAFSKKFHVKVTTEVLQPEAILQRVRSERFNAEMDILLTEDEALRQSLRSLKALKTIRNVDLFGQLERPFSNRHHSWIPVSHDPLIVTMARDTSNNCKSIDFRSWHRADSLRPALVIKRHRDDYLSLLGKSAHLGWLKSAGASRRQANETVYPLSEFIALENSRDSLYHSRAHACRFFLVDNKRYVSRVNTASIYRYGRNNATAESFLTYFLGNAYSVASGRNQLPARKNTSANWYVRSLSIQ